MSPWGLGHVPSSRSRDTAGGAGGTLRGRVSCVRVRVSALPRAGEAPSIAPRGHSLPQLPGAAPAVLSPSPRGRGTKHRCPFVTLCHRRRLQQEAERRDREQQQRVSSSAGLSEGLRVPNPGGAPPVCPLHPPLSPFLWSQGGGPVSPTPPVLQKEQAEEEEAEQRRGFRRSESVEKAQVRIAGGEPRWGAAPGPSAPSSPPPDPA